MSDDRITQPGRTMRLGLFVQSTGHHIAGWRLPGAEADAGSNLRHHIALAQAAEAAKFDLLFLADSYGIKGADHPGINGRTSRAVTFEPTTLLGALAAVTARIGLVATASTTYCEPYHLARQFASIDHLSHGRAGWNAVTSTGEVEARNFGLEAHPDHDERYGRAEEFIEVVTGLWDSWDDDAFPRDKASGIFFDSAGLNVLNHKGEEFRVKGPLNLPRPPQGHPILIQSGASEPGRTLAARRADLVFTAQRNPDDARVFRTDIRNRAEAFGRDPDSIAVMPGFSYVVAGSEDEARALHQQLQDLVDPAVALQVLSTALGGVDLSPYPIDGPVPDLPETNGPRSRQRLLLDAARQQNLSIRQLALQVVGARGHRTAQGTGRQIADELEHWFRSGAADGFNIMPSHFPGGFDDFVRLVLPELQQRGIVRTAYHGRTLRDHLGLARPALQRTAAKAVNR